ncbi:hypothetical protein [Brevundimonas sp.]|uniref:hypothetical protein n=1 Tax=Brevundimonas sp. TaxID=1871086 RepID=UPI00286C6832|nr:hypothetical protein [Brevundimonas sp.]
MPDTNYDKSSTSTRKYRYDLQQRVAVAAANAASAEINDAGEVMLHATTDCYVTVAALDPVANAATNAFPMLAGEKFHLQINVGDQFGVIRASADGYLFILPVDGRVRV